eukprot:scaffold13629_cov101-Isochrysis_galbana.AAC.6
MLADIGRAAGAPPAAGTAWGNTTASGGTAGEATGRHAPWLWVGLFDVTAPVSPSMRRSGVAAIETRRRALACPVPPPSESDVPGSLPPAGCAVSASKNVCSVSSSVPDSISSASPTAPQSSP